ncbi:hypothetical protein [Rubellimicrobium aerolatum]|uniref:Uncharacterized protein n=1 Tax=Rubellimicrobium aerolatum TaxID=490979 RepID=A0ABW0SHC4_9RHOB|nr:hypothetical protein [Rubellimicrobium aerolatum]MBP1807428.1 hypothetical protein [Rubellimicrobium aerolatum]
MGRIATLALVAALMGPGALRAERAFDIVFRSGTLDGLPGGTQLLYDGGAAVPDGGWSRVVVDLAGDGAAVVQGDRADGAEPLGRFDAGVGNPVAMVFLERTVRTISEATGGSPFYIRNRIRDALAGEVAVAAVTVPWDGGTVEATEVALSPFATDAHRADLGRFADLEIRVVVSESVPGWYHSIRAEAPAGASAEAYDASLALVEE